MLTFSSGSWQERPRYSSCFSLVLSMRMKILKNPDVQPTTCIWVLCLASWREKKQIPLLLRSLFTKQIDFHLMCLIYVHRQDFILVKFDAISFLTQPLVHSPFISLQEKILINALQQLFFSVGSDPQRSLRPFQGIQEVKLFLQ